MKNLITQFSTMVSRRKMKPRADAHQILKQLKIN